MKKKSSLKWQMLLAVSLFSLPVAAEEIKTSAALMQAMDKVTGRVNKITVPVNSKITFGDFSLVLRSCKKRPAEETPENFAFIDVADKSFGKDEYNIFRGWILSSTPGINAIEHPIYDVWLLECVDEKVDSAQILTQEELDARDKLPQKENMMVSKESKTAETIANEEDTPQDVSPNVIHIKEFIQEDRDIEKDIKEVPTYISETTNEYVSDIEEGEEPENLLLFTKMQEVHSETTPSAEKTDENDLSEAIDAEINNLKSKD